MANVNGFSIHITAAGSISNQEVFTLENEWKDAYYQKSGGYNQKSEFIYDPFLQATY